MTELPTWLADEVESRLFSIDPMFRELFNREECILTGQELQKLCSGMWLGGYGEALGEVADAPKGELPPLADYFVKQAGL